MTTSDRFGDFVVGLVTNTVDANIGPASASTENLRAVARGQVFDV